jgi:putative flavoprotein involved in K+ transport
MTTQHIETLVIGAGQAGLATGSHLRKLGREALIVDGNERVGDNWRCHWDSLRLFTPAKYDGLPGLPFPGDAWSFPGKDDVADYLEAYALEMDLPVRLQTRVDRLVARPGGGFTAHLGAHTITSDNVVVATGTRGRTPHVPEFAGRLAPSIRQLQRQDLHSVDGAGRQPCADAPYSAGTQRDAVCPRPPRRPYGQDQEASPGRTGCAVAGAAGDRGVR